MAPITTIDATTPELDPIKQCLALDPMLALCFTRTLLAVTRLLTVAPAIASRFLEFALGAIAVLALDPGVCHEAIIALYVPWC